MADAVGLDHKPRGPDSQSLFGDTCHLDEPWPGTLWNVRGLDVGHLDSTVCIWAGSYHKAAQSPCSADSQYQIGDTGYLNEWGRQI